MNGLMTTLGGLCLLTVVAVAQVPAEGTTNAFSGQSHEAVYHRGVSLRMKEDLPQAYACFEHVARALPPGTMLDWECNPEWWMGRIELRWGHVYRAETNFVAGLDRARKLGQQITDPARRWHVMTQEYKILGNLKSCHTETGRRTQVRNVEREIRSICEEADTLAASIPDFKPPGCCKAVPIEMMLDRADALLEEGLIAEHDESLVRAVDMADALYEFVPLHRTLLAVSGNHEAFNRWGAALEMAEKAEILPRIDQYAFEWYNATARLAWLRSHEQGFNEEYLTAADEAIEKLKASDSPAWGALLYKAAILHSGGRLEAAMSVAEEVATETLRLGLKGTWVEALIRRVEIQLDRDPSDNRIADDVVQALLFHRSMGNKMREPHLYELYARWLMANGHKATALEALQQALEFCRQDPRIAHWTGPLEARYAEALLIPDTTAGDGLAESESGSDPEGVLDVSAPDDSTRQASPVAVDEPVILLQPRSIISSQGVGEPAVAWFTLYNAGSVGLTGNLAVVSNSSGWTGHVRDIMNQELWNLEEPGDLVCPPAQTLFLEVGLPPSAGVAATNSLQFIWNRGAASSQWDVIAGVGGQTLTVVDASRVGANPLYLVPVYHVLRLRGSAEGDYNLKIEASVPCRIELVDVYRSRLLAIDATGNGSFVDPGDDVYRDSDEDNVPDLPVEAADGMAILQYRARPLNVVTIEPIDLSLFVKVGNTWQLQAVDRIEP